jgi:type 2 lantibiotic biosynthesis protein LanM
MKKKESRYRDILNAIAARASTPPERQRLEHQADTGASEGDIKARVEHLYSLVGATDEEKIQQFLAYHHLDQQQIESFLSSPPPELLADQLPDWTRVLERVVTEFTLNIDKERNTTPTDPSLWAEDPLPFEEVLLPFVQYARQQSRQRVASHISLLEDKVLTSLEHWLLAKLSEFAGSTLQIEFSLFRQQHSFWGTSSERREIYDAFVAQYLPDEGLLQLFQEYSVLARSLVLLVEQWIDICTEFLQRLAADLDEIAKTFHNGHALGPVVKVLPDYSDPHHHGRTVFLVDFAEGVRVVYKPRSLAVDQAFSDLLTWCNEHGLSPSLKTPRVLNRATHGWTEYVTQQACSTRQEVQNYYLRAGMLLCWLYVLRGTDMHQSNVIASGEHPVLVDLETILNPGFPPRLQLRDRSAQKDDCTYQKHSVLLTRLLPDWRWEERIKQACDLSGLGGVETHVQPRPQRRWKHTNTDAMSRELVYLPGRMKDNLVILQDAAVNPMDYEEEVVTGFCLLYRFLVKYRRELLAPEGPLGAFIGCPLRFIHRDTNTYGEALIRLEHPTFLREGTDRWIELQVFTYPLLEVQADPYLWKVVESEQFALQGLDIPWFGTGAESHDLWLETGEILPEAFPHSALEQTRSCLQRLSEADLAQQCQLIRTAYLLARPTTFLEEEFPPLAEEMARHNKLRTNDLVEVACQIGRDLRAHAFSDIQEKGTWMGLHLHDTSQWFYQEAVGFDLYQGACGIALFLAALDKVTGEHTYRDLIASTLKPVCRNLRHDACTPSAQSEWKIGGASGLGSLIYTLSRIGIWSDLPELLEGARHAARLLTAQRVHTDQDFDVIAGSAGAILGLLTLYQNTQDPELLEQARLCGEHLREQRVETTSGARSWTGLQQRPLTGFSHGAAGIAYALLRLTEATGESVWKEVAEEALAFEQSVFSPQAGNWPDLREQPDTDPSEATPKFVTAWCHGATGVGLARLGGLMILDTPQVRQDLTVALRTTQADGLPSNDCLCCGNFGRIELLMAASQRLQQPQLLEVARQWTSVLVGRARQRGGFHVFPRLPRQAYNPGLFQGYAGIGYELLRVAFPDRVPSVLLWE